jgi:hypothetical protein
LIDVPAQAMYNTFRLASLTKLNGVENASPVGTMGVFTSVPRFNREMVVSFATNKKSVGGGEGRFVGMDVGTAVDGIMVRFNDEPVAIAIRDSEMNPASRREGVTREIESTRERKKALDCILFGVNFTL